MFKHHKSKIYWLALTIVMLTVGFLFMPSKPSELLSLFPLENYDQTISHWIKSSDADYDQALLTPAQQKIRKDELYAKYFGARSPWSANYIQQVFSEPAAQGLQSAEKGKLTAFDNSNRSADHIQYGSNFIPHSNEWIQAIENNMNLKQFAVLHYDVKQRGIAIDNTQGRVLPTNDVSFYSHKLAGQGYPFDNLQAANIWAGTPVYILGESKDRSWYLVHTPNFIAWVKSNTIARADETFVKQWQQQAEKNIAAITQTRISMIDVENKTYRFSAYIGMLFPAVSDVNGFRVAIPVADANQQAKIYHVSLTSHQAALIPLLPTPHHFAELMQQLIGRPYGWGGMYRHSDCSAELKNLFIPFGILLPMHSSNQVDPESFIVKQVDLSSSNMDERLAYLAQHGHKFMTIVHVGGHVFLYLGNYKNPRNPNEEMILTYQAMWGLKPVSADNRTVIGKSVLFPLLKSYPEVPQLVSQANKAIFQLGYLDPQPEEVTQAAKIDLQKSISP